MMLHEARGRNGIAWVLDYASMSSIATLAFEVLLGLSDDPASIAGTSDDACGY